MFIDSVGVTSLVESYSRVIDAVNDMSEGLEPSDEDMRSVDEVWRDMTDELGDLLDS